VIGCRDHGTYQIRRVPQLVSTILHR
jgi:hypothetical protein